MSFVAGKNAIWSTSSWMGLQLARQYVLQGWMPVSRGAPKKRQISFCVVKWDVQHWGFGSLF
jgi:hypothetical protein